MNRATSILIFCVAVLLGLGMITLYSSSMNMELNRAAVGSDFLRSQMVWGVIGLAGCAVAAAVDYRRWKPMAPWILGFSVLLLILVFVPHIGWAAKAGHGGGGAEGAHRWIGVPYFPMLPHFQPSELAKLALILFLAAYAERYQRQMETFQRGFLIPAAVIGVILGLVFVEPDRGCAMLLAAVAGTVLLVAGARLRYLAPAGLAGVGGLAWSLLHDPMRHGRIFAWLHPELTKEDAGYQPYQAMIAFGSGGWTGVGLGDSRQKLGFIQEHHTDFIFAIIGEELGLVATLLVVMFFVALLFCGIYIARRACDTFGRLLACGITFMISIQAFINMGVAASLLPCKGMPLPFISYGGSNLLLMLVSVGLLLSISRSAAEPAEAKDNPFDASPKLSDE
ncbi:MAG: putative lipid II flippase FtsW [Verrucomicrobiota bacterium]|jgi:cell division protein FtsW